MSPAPRVCSTVGGVGSVCFGEASPPVPLLSLDGVPLNSHK